MAIVDLLTVTPAIVEPIIVERTLLRSSLMNAGVLDINTNPMFTQGGNLHTMRYLKSINNIGDENRLTKDYEAAGTDIGDYSENAPIVRSAKEINSYELDKIIQGVDVISEISSYVADYTADQRDKRLQACLNGVFATGGALDTADHVTTATTILDAAAIGAGKLLLGNQKRDLKTLIVHPKQFNDMFNNALIEYVSANAFSNNALISGDIPTYLGMQVVESEEICALIGGKYHAYLMGGKPLYLGFQRSLNMWNKFFPEKAGGLTMLGWTQHYAPGIKGCSWNAVSTLNPTDVQLATAANWTLEAATKAVPIVLIKTT